MAMEYNKSPICIREGSVYLDGVEVYDSVSCTIKFTPEVWTGKNLGDRTSSSRWIGGDYTGEMTRRRATAWLKEAVQEYIDTGVTPEFTIQGIMDDPNSDYYDTYGAETVTAVGCVLTGDIQLLALDAAGDVLNDSIGFNAKDVV